MEAFQQEDTMTQERKAKQFLLRTGQHPASSVESLVKKREGDFRSPQVTRDYPLGSLLASGPLVSDRRAVLLYSEFRQSATPCSSMTVRSISQYYMPRNFGVKLGQQELSELNRRT
jgi:hypothetical protein